MACHIQIINTGPCFCTGQCFTQAPNRMLSNQLDTLKKVPLPAGALTPHVIHVPWTHPTQHPKLHVDRFSHLCTVHSRVSLCFTTCIKTWLMHN